VQENVPFAIGLASIAQIFRAAKTLIHLESVSHNSSASTTPEMLDPSVSGRSCGNALLPARIHASHGPTPAAFTRTRTSVARRRRNHGFESNDLWSAEPMNPACVAGRYQCSARMVRRNCGGHGANSDPYEE
jgi:hypothetical protein